MATQQSESNPGVRYEPNESPPLAITAGLGFQFAVLTITGIVLTPAIVIRAAGGTESYLSWAVFAAVLVCGTTTILQALGKGRIGAGYVLLMGTSAAFISVSIGAIAQGGPAMLGTLVVVSALFQYTLGAHLSLFRRILTPTIAGTVIMLIAVTVMPIIFDMLDDVPDGATSSDAAITVAATLVVIIPVALRATGALRLWAPVLGVFAGSAAAVWVGVYDFELVREAAWLGLAEGSWPGLDLSFNATFWSLLPAFVFVTLVGAIETIGDAIAIQGVSWRQQRAVDYRAVQGAVNADGTGNLLSGLLGTVPNTTYSTSVSVTELTGVASRTVGVAIGVIFLGMAFVPKLVALILAIPGPVAAAYVTVLLAMLFVLGMKIVIQDGIDYRKGLIVGVSFWIGVGFQNGVIFPEYFSEFAGGTLQNGMTSGGLAAMILTLFSELTQSRSRRIEMHLEVGALPKIMEFLEQFAARHRWEGAMLDRLGAAAEETLLTLLREDEEGEATDRQLRLTARKRDGRAILEFAAASEGANLQDRIALLGEPTSVEVERDMSLRLLRHFTSSIRHQQYHDGDIVTIEVEAP